MQQSLATRLLLIVTFALIPSFADASGNAGDFAGPVAIGTGYAGIDTAPTDSLIVGNSIGIGSSNPAAQLDVAGTSRLIGNITTNITGSTQCLQVSSLGVISGAGSSCGGSGITQNQATSGNYGFANKLRNAQMEIAQRGTSGTVTTSADLYTLDGWEIHTTGASVTWAQTSGVTIQTTESEDR